MVPPPTTPEEEEKKKSCIRGKSATTRDNDRKYKKTSFVSLFPSVSFAVVSYSFGFGNPTRMMREWEEV